MKKNNLLSFLLIIGLAYAESVFAQPIKNIFPDPGRVGIGTVNGTTVAPDDLLHIHGILPGGGATYEEPTLRISLDDNDILFKPPTLPTGMKNLYPDATKISEIYGQLSMQNTPTGMGIIKYSKFAKKYDLVLSTSTPLSPALILPTSGVTNTIPYSFDLIITTKNPKAALRFGTTPPFAGTIPPTPPINATDPGPWDLERMTILNTGNVGIGNNDPKSLLTIGNNINITPATFGSGGNWGHISYNDFWNGSSGARLEGGSACGLVFVPSTTTGGAAATTTQSSGSNGGIYLYTAFPGAANDNISTQSALRLSPEKLQLSAGPTSGDLLTYTFPTSTASTNHDGWLFIKNRVCIGTTVNSNIRPFSVNKTSTELTEDDFYKLSVNGSILAKEIVVDAHANWSDFVFNPDYKLPTLTEVENFIAINHHLPEIPSAKEVETQGQDIGTIQAKLLQKVEELTLYIIKLQKDNDNLQKRVLLLESSK